MNRRYRLERASFSFIFVLVIRHFLAKLQVSAYIFPSLGPIRTADIFPENIRELISRMQRDGRSAWTIQYCKSSILSSIFTTALNDQVTYIHPCQGVKSPVCRLPRRRSSPRSSLTPSTQRSRTPTPGSWWNRHRDRTSLG